MAHNLSHVDTVHALITYFFKTCFNNIFQVVPSSSNWPLRLPTQKFSADKKNQLDVTFCILYCSSNSYSTCFGQPCAHHQKLKTA